jgi:MFS family permease
MSFTSAPASAFSPRWSDVYIGAIARAIDNGGDMLAAVALALVLQGAGHGGAAVAGLLLAAAVPPMLLAPIAGRIADRYDSRHLLVGVGLVQVAICVLLAFATSVPAVIGLVALLATGMSITSPTFSALTPAMVGRDNLAKAGGISQSAGLVGSLLGPVLGGFLVGAFGGARWPLLIDAATYLAVPIAALLIKTRRRGGVSNVPAEQEPASSSTWTVWTDPLLRPLMILFAAVLVSVVAINVVDVFYVRQTLHGSATLYGALSALWMIGMLIGTVLISRRKLSDAASARGMLLALAGTCGIVLVIGLMPNAWWLLPLEVIGGITNGVENVLDGVLLGRRAPADRRGRAYATVNGLANAAQTVGLAIGGAALTLWNDPRAIVIGTGIAGLAALLPFTLPLLRAARIDAALVAAAATADQPAAAATA